MAYIKGSIKKDGDVILPLTALDKIVSISGNSSSTAGTSILVSGTSRIKADHLPDNVVYTDNGTISLSVFPSITSTYLPSNVVYTTEGKVSDTILPSTVPLLNSVTGKLSKDVIPGGVDDIIQLVAYTDNPPTTGVVTGNQCYDSSVRKIKTYDGTAWSNAASPSIDVLYYVPSTKKTYRWAADASDTTYGGDMVEIAAAIAVTKQGSSSVVVLTESDDFVPSDKVVKKAIANAITGSVAVASGTTPGLVYVSGATSSAKGVKLTLNTSTGALEVTGVTAGTSASAAGVVYVSGGESSAKGVKLTLSSGALTVTGVEAGTSASAAGVVYVSDGESSSNGVKLTLSSGALSITTSVASTSAPGTIRAVSDFTAYTTSDFNNVYAATPAAVKGWVDKIFTDGDGLQITNNKASIKLQTASGLSVSSAGLKVDGLTGAMVANGLTAGTGIKSITGGTITAVLSFVAD